MIKKYIWWIVFINLCVVLFLFNKSLIQKEQILENGDLLLLALAPVDPRSLMQGDYMILNYAIARTKTQDMGKRGYCVIRKDSLGVGQLVSFEEKPATAEENLFSLRYNVVGYNRVSLGAESYFFQEGQGERYEAAKYGGLKVDKEGHSILVGLWDKDLKFIDKDTMPKID